MRFLRLRSATLAVPCQLVSCSAVGETDEGLSHNQTSHTILLLSSSSYPQLIALVPSTEVTGFLNRSLSI